MSSHCPAGDLQGKSAKRGAWQLLVRYRCLVWLAADNALNTHDLHQPGDRATGDVEALTPQLPPDLADAVDAPVGIEHALNMGPKLLVPLGTVRQTGRISPPRKMIIIGGRGDRQHVADRLDPVLVPSRA